jgi:hypothetical protein
MNIVIQGLDRYVVEKLSALLTLPLSRLTTIPTTDIFFLASETIVYHHGVDQTTWWSFITIYLTADQARFQQAMIDLFKQALRGQTIHYQFTWMYRTAEQVTSIIDQDYPPFMTESNQVKVEETSIHPDQEIYLGNAFSGYEDNLNKLDPSPAQVNKKTKPAKSLKKDRS